jgi:hypothetical protein
VEFFSNSDKGKIWLSPSLLSERFVPFSYTKFTLIEQPYIAYIFHLHASLPYSLLLREAKGEKKNPGNI